MKLFIAFAFLLVPNLFLAQDVPVQIDNFRIPLNTKVTIKMNSQQSSGKSTFSVIKSEPYQKLVDKSDITEINNSKGEPETIEFYLCQEISDADKNTKKNVLLIRNFSKFQYKFKTEIQSDKNASFLKFKNVEVHGSGFRIMNWIRKTESLRILDII